MKLKNVGYEKDGLPCCHAAAVAIPLGETREVPDAYAAHLLRWFPGQFVAVAGEPSGLAIEFAEDAPPVKSGKRKGR